MLSTMIVKYYMDPAESYSFAVISISIRLNFPHYTSLSITVSMICILMVPIDVFVTSHPNELF